VRSCVEDTACRGSLEASVPLRPGVASGPVPVPARWPSDLGPRVAETRMLPGARDRRWQQTTPRSGTDPPLT